MTDRHTVVFQPSGSRGEVPGGVHLRSDARSLGVANGERVKLVSNDGDCIIAAKLSPSVRPGQVIVYNGFEPYMHQDWYSQADLEAGHVKHLGMVGNYGHLKYRVFSWQPIPADRAVRVDVEKLA